jgi:hypothetical protein
MAKGDVPRSMLRPCPCHELHESSTLSCRPNSILSRHCSAHRLLPSSSRAEKTVFPSSGFAGIATGAAMAGLRPVVEFMTWNFSMQVRCALSRGTAQPSKCSVIFTASCRHIILATVALPASSATLMSETCEWSVVQAIDHVINSASKIHYMSAGDIQCPIVFRSASKHSSHAQCPSKYPHLALLHSTGRKLGNLCSLRTWQGSQRSRRGCRSSALAVFCILVWPLPWSQGCRSI